MRPRYVAERHEIATRHNADRCDGGLKLGRRAAELCSPVAQLVVFVHVDARAIGWALLLSSAMIPPLLVVDGLRVGVTLR